MALSNNRNFKKLLGVTLTNCGPLGAETEIVRLARLAATGQGPTERKLILAAVKNRLAVCSIRSSENTKAFMARTLNA